MMAGLIKPINFLKSGYSYLKGSVSGKAEIKGMPIAVSTELTNRCNLHCPQCSTGSGRMLRESGFMEIGLFNRVMKELTPYLYCLNLYFQGEPMLHPLFFSFINNCPKPYTIVSTNGHFLSVENSERLARSGLNKLIISIDGIDQQTYSAYRVNGSINSVIDGIKNVTRAKHIHNSSLKIEIQFLVNRLNEHQIPEIRLLAKSVNASLRLKSMQVIDKADIKFWTPSIGKFSRYEMTDGEYVIKNTMPDRCARLWFNPVITWDGKVIPCCFDKNAEYEMGDLNNDSFTDIWNGPKYRIFRKSILTGRHMIGICRNCTSGLRGVKY
jgi:radical SAM protein with 4Fe4S-binding SPASM domain